MKKLIVTATLMLCLPAAFAAPPFPTMDTNKDGKATLEEFSKWRTDFFKTRNQPEKATAKKNEGAFKKIDANSDGVITAEEFEAHAAKMKQKK